MTAKIDVPALYASLDKVRLAKDWTWYKVSQDTGISQTTFTRLKNGKGVDLGKLLTLAKWCGSDVERFIVKHAK